MDGGGPVKTVLWGLYGAVLGVVYGGLSAILLAQIIGLRGGMRFGLDNILLEVVPPQAPVLPTLAVVLLSGLVVVGLTVGIARRPPRAQIAAVVAFAVVIVAMAVSSLAGDGWRVLDAESRGMVAPAPEGWIHVAGASPLTQSVALVVVGALWFRLRQRRRAAVSAAAPVGADIGD